MSIYMKIDGMTGDVTAKGFENTIELLSMRFSTKRQLNMHPGQVSDRESSHAMMTEVTVSKLMDRATPTLFSESVIGTANSNIRIVLLTSSDALTPYMEYTLSNTIVSAYDVVAMPKNDNHDSSAITAYPVETINLSFDHIEMRFTPFDENQKPQSPIAASYSMRTATAA